MTLGELVDALEKRPKKQGVYFDLLWLVPTCLDSYRGYYEQLALGFRVDENPRLTVAELLKDCEAAIGERFQGWKGGEYMMDRDTPIWVANPGNTSEYYISGIDTLGDDAHGWTIIKTEKE